MTKRKKREELRQCLITNTTRPFLRRDFNAVLWYFSEHLGGVPVGSEIDPETLEMTMLGWHIKFKCMCPNERINSPGPPVPYDFTVPYLPKFEKKDPEINGMVHDIPQFFTMITGIWWGPLKALDIARNAEAERRKGLVYKVINPVWDALEQLKNVQAEIAETERRLKTVREQFGLRGVSYDGVRTSKTNAVKSPAEGGALRSLAVQEDLEALFEKQQEAQRWMLRWIMDVDHVRVRRALMLHFYDGLTWDDVSLEMGGRVRSTSTRDMCKRWVNNYYAAHPDFEPPEYLKNRENA